MSDSEISQNKVSLSLKGQEEELFSKWKKLRPDEPFIKDGVMDENCYLAQKRKIVFVLKDAYDNKGSSKDWDLCENVLKEAFVNWKRDQTWPQIARWAYGLLQLHEKPDISQDELDTKISDKLACKEILRSIAVMNVKKVLSRTSITDRKALKEHREDRENLSFLCEQWKLYQPDITVCGGWEAFYAMRNALQVYDQDVQRTRRGTYYWKIPSGQLFIQAVHPAARCPDELKCFMVLDAVQDAKT